VANIASLSVDRNGAARALRVERSGQIKAARDNGHLDESIKLCLQASVDFPFDPFYLKILSDLYFEKEQFDLSLASLISFSILSRYSHSAIGNFATRLFRIKKVMPLEQFKKILGDSLPVIREKQSDKTFSDKLVAIIEPETISIPALSIESEEVQEFVRLLTSGRTFEKLVAQEKIVEQKHPNLIPLLLNEYVLHRPRGAQTFQTDLYCVSLYERFGDVDSAIKVAKELTEFRYDPIAIRSLFRASRKNKDYSVVERLLSENPNIRDSSDFNVLYELVYYYDARSEELERRKTLHLIERRFAQNVVVLQTVRNFYARFQMIDEFRSVDATINGLMERNKSAQFAIAEEESRSELASKITELYSQLEHHKQLAAISDLTTGISHELGQPITNIRYTLQFYRRIFERKLVAEDVFKVFDSVLEETERMGGLVSRLSPLTSSRGVIEEFDLADRVRKRFQNEHARLLAGRIKAKVDSIVPVLISADPVKVDQLISNLLLNSIDAIKEVKDRKAGKIVVKITNQGDSIRMRFKDDGIGIPRENRRKIFDPFFSTKPPGKGEGLGLFIVWNLIKMLGGDVVVDSSYFPGACFVIDVPKTRIEG